MNNIAGEHHALPNGMLTIKTSNIFSVHVGVVAKLTDFPSLFRDFIKFFCAGGQWGFTAGHF